MKILKTLGLIILALVAIVVILGIIAPKGYELKRSIVINAPAPIIYKNISTFEAFTKWNPFKKMDPAQTTKIEGTDGTIGAKYSWNSKKVGQGSMTTAKMETNKSVDYDMAFVMPLGEMKSTSAMWMEPADGGQKVTWEFKGTSPFPFNIMNLLGNMDKEMGPTFDDGLNALKSMSETEAAATPAYQVKEVEWSGKNCLAIRKTVAFKDLGEFFGTNFPKISSTLDKTGAKMTGAPLGIFYSWDMKEMKADVAAAIPYDKKKNFGKEFQELNLPASKAYSADYYGNYNKEKPVYDALDAKLKGMGQDKPQMAIEEYLTDPMAEKDTTKWHTVIYYIPNTETAKK